MNNIWSIILQYTDNIYIYKNTYLCYSPFRKFYNREKKIKQRYKNHLIILLELFPDKPWDWKYISNHPNITWEIISDNLDKDWDWQLLSKNPNITWYIISQNLDKPWDWRGVSRNPNVTWEIISNNLNKNWNWRVLSYRKFRI